MRPFPARVLLLHAWVGSIRFVGQAGMSRVSLMRRLLIAAVLLYAGSAQAIDYAQCEAMQRAVTRIEGSREEAIDTKLQQLKAEYVKIECPKTFKPNTSKIDWSAFYSCEIDAVERFLDMPELTAALIKARDPYNEKIEKVQSDYEKAGCY